MPVCPALASLASDLAMKRFMLWLIFTYKKPPALLHMPVASWCQLLVSTYSISNCTCLDKASLIPTLLWIPELMQRFLQIQVCINYLPRFMTYSTVLCLNELMLPILHNFKDTVPPNKANPYGHINWSWPQTQPQSSSYLSHSSVSVRVVRARPKAGFWFDVQNGLCFGLMVYHLQRSFIWKVKFLRVVRIAGSNLVMYLSVPPILRRGGAVGDVVLFLLCCSLQLYQHHLHQECRLVQLPSFWINGEV